MRQSDITNIIHSVQGGEKEVAGKYLTFWVEGQLFGIPIANVEQIIGLQKVTEIPDFPHYAKGIINLRGTVIPVIDIRLRFRKQEAEYTDRTCIIVTEIQQQLFGFLVDSVEEVADIDHSDISPPPTLSNDSSIDYLSGVARMTDSMILLLDIRKLLSDTEFLSLTNLST